RLAIDQRNPADLAWPLGMNHVIVDRREVEDLGEGVANLAVAVVQPEQANFAVPEIVAHAGKGKNGFAELNAKMASRVLDCRRRNLLDPADDREAKRATPAVEPAEQQHGGRFRNFARWAFDDA